MYDPTQSKRTAAATNGINLVSGLWLIAAPWVLGYEETEAMWNDVVAGVLVVMAAGVKATNPIRYLRASWVNVIVGVWLILAPFVLQYGGDNVISGVNKALWNDVVLGILIVVPAWLSATIVKNPAPEEANNRR